MSYRYKPRSKRRYFGLIALVGIFFLIYVFRHGLLVFGVEWMLASAFPKSANQSLSYERIQLQDGKVVILGLNVSEESYHLTVDRIEMGCKANLWQFYLEPHLQCIHPQLTLISGEDNDLKVSLLSSLIPGNHFAVKLDVQNGVLQLHGPQPLRYYFKFVSNEAREKIGTAMLSFDPGTFSTPLLLLDLEMQEELISTIKIQGIDSTPLLQLGSFFYPSLQKGWENVQGEVEITAKANWQFPLALREVQGKIDLDHLVLSNAQMGFYANIEELHSEFSYSDQLKAKLTLENGECAFSQMDDSISLNNLSAHFEIEPGLDPSLNISGKILHGEKESPLLVVGKGSLQEGGAFWLEVDSTLCATSLHLSMCSQEKNAYVTELSLLKSDMEGIYFIQQLAGLGIPAVKQIKLIEGDISGKLRTFTENSTLRRLQFSECLAKELRWSGASQGGFVELKLEGCLDAKEEGFKVTDLKASLKEGDLLHSSLWSISNFEMDLAVKDDEILSSTLQGQYGEIGAKISLKGKKTAGDVNVELLSTTDALAHILGKKSALSGKNVAVSSLIKVSGNVADVEGDLQIDHLIAKEKIDFGFSINDLSHLDGKDLISSISQRLEHGYLRSEKLSALSYGPFIEDVSLQGDIDVFGTFDAKGGQCYLQGTNLIVDHPYFRLEVAQLGEKDPQLLKTDGRADIRYDAKTKRLSATFPLSNAKVFEKTYGTFFEKVSGNFVFDKNVLQTQLLSAECEGLDFKGRLKLQNDHLELTTNRLQGSAASFAKLLKHFPAFTFLSIPLDGSFVIEKDRLSLATGKDGAIWKIQANLRDVVYPLNNASQLKALNLDLNIDSQDESVSISNLTSKLSFKENLYQLNGKSLNLWGFDAPSLEFDLQLLDKNKEVAHLKGEGAENENSELEFFFDTKSTHFFGTSLEIEKLKFKNQKVHVFEMKPSIKIEELISQVNFLSTAGFMPEAKMLLSSLKEMEGVLLTKVEYDSLRDQLLFQIEGKGVSYKKIPLKKASLKGSKIGSQWTIESFQVDDMFIKSSFLPQKGGVNIPSVEAKYKDIYLRGSGVYRSDSHQMVFSFPTMQSDLKAMPDLPLLKNSSLSKLLASGSVVLTLPSETAKLKVEGAFEQASALMGDYLLLSDQKMQPRWIYSLETGLKVEEMRLLVQGKISKASLGEILLEQLSYDLAQNCGQIKKISLSLSSEMVGKVASQAPVWVKNGIASLPFKASAMATFDPEFVRLEGQLKNAPYHVGGLNCDVTDFALLYEKKEFFIQTKTILEKTPLFADLKIASSKGILQVRSDTKQGGIVLNFKSDAKKEFLIESLYGSLCGIEASFAKSSQNALAGSLRVDMAQAAKLLPQDLVKNLQKFKLGKGYEVSGELVQGRDGAFEFTGQLKGKEFEMLGYQLRSLNAQIQMNERHGCLKNVSVIDEALQLSIKQIDWEKRYSTWSFDIPLVQVKDLKPSYLNKIGAKESVIKPLNIRNLSIYNLSGELNNPSTFSGNGHLDFTNAFKKDLNLLDIPLDMIKNIGLDPGLFTPVCGEIEFEFRGPKVLLTDLKNCYSEGKRSHFYLPPDKDMSYLDLEGNLRVSVKMHQYVLLKFVEPFTVNIRGSLEKPSYSVGAF